MPDSSRSNDVAVVLDGVRRVVRALRVAASGVEDATGLTSAQLFVLQTVARAPGCSLTEVAARTMTDRTSVAAVVERLESRGLIVRARSTVDLRRVELHPTAPGTKLLEGAPHPPTRRLLDALETLGADELHALSHGLSAVVTAMGLEQESVEMLFEDRAPMRPKRERRAARAR